MLAQVPFGLPNLAALGAAAATAGLNPVLFTNQSVFGAHTFTGVAQGAINPVLFQNQNQFFNPTLTLTGNLIIQPILFENRSAFPHHLFTWDQALAPAILVNSNRFFQHIVNQQAPEPIYTFPIGHSLDSDYGMRRAMTFYKQTLVIGRR